MNASMAQSASRYTSDPQELRKASEAASAATQKAQQKLESAIAKTRAGLAKLDVPWTVRGVVPITPPAPAPVVPSSPPPPGGNIQCVGPIGGRMSPVSPPPAPAGIYVDPYYVLLERFGGAERRVAVYPKARSEAEAIALASAECAKDVKNYDARADQIIQQSGVHAALEALKTADAAEQQALARLRCWPRAY